MFTLPPKSDDFFFNLSFRCWEACHHDGFAEIFSNLPLNLSLLIREAENLSFSAAIPLFPRALMVYGYTPPCGSMGSCARESSWIP
jgi:hypothetical protein